jgi:hypothetical protein
MFGLFGKSEPKINVIDKVWMTKEAKWRACAAMMEVNPPCIFVAWFEGTKKELVQVLGSDEKILLADKLDFEKLMDKMVVFAEHYPLPQREQTLFKNLNLKEIPVTSSLDEPLFMHFGGEKLIDIIRKLGMKEDEVIGHAFITSAIQNAQRKLEKNVRIEKQANSAQEWFALNVQS